jgi:hypothetical protein
MLNLRQFQAEATDWGISLRERFELEGHIRGGLKPLDEFAEGDRREEDFRGRVADILIENGLEKRAARYMECSRFGYCLECEGQKPHKFFSVLCCDIRFCPHCASRMFARLYQKYSPILAHLGSHSRRGFLLRELTLTSRNTGVLNAEQIKQFNKDVKRTLKTLMQSIKGWGAIWCDEVGFNNQNLHAHVLFYGPYIDQRHLATVWNDISGHQVVWIKKAHTDGARALLYLLKYVSKPPADDPEFIGQLEVAFYKCRRVHTLELFYNFAPAETGNLITSDVAEPGNLTTSPKQCPVCGAKLRRIIGNAPINDLVLQGIRFIGEYRPAKERQSWLN